MELPKRKSPRIPGYDYSSVNYYFITICTRDKKCIFGHPGKRNVFRTIAQYKSGVTREIRKISSNEDIWQRSYHDHIIRNQKSYEKIWMYIENNPQKWEDDCFYIDNV